jgi:hypothetical protein
MDSGNTSVTPARQIYVIAPSEAHVVFLPYMPPPNDGVWTFQETEMMRHLIC